MMRNPKQKSFFRNYALIVLKIYSALLHGEEKLL